MTVHTKNELFVAGSWAPARGERITMTDPSTEEPVYEVPEAGKDEIDTAVAAACEVHDAGSWASVPPAERAAYLLRFADELEKREPELNVQLAREFGAPIGIAREVAGAAGLTRYLGSRIGEVNFEVRLSGAFRPTLVDQVPVGVVAAVVPWNAPIFLAVQKAVPAPLAGCPVIIKPAPETAYSAFALAEAFEAAELPAGAISVLPAGREMSEYLVAHAGIDKISFTGSTATGQRIAAIAAGGIKRTGLELGGKSAGVILPDADFAEIMPAILLGTTVNSGQACSLLSRLLLPHNRRDEFLDAYTAALDTVVVGPALDPKTTMGPMVTWQHYAKVVRHIDIGRREGARLIRGGGRPAGLDRGYFLEPTLFADVDNGMRIAREEIFGPVIAILPYKSEEEVIRLANETIYGLAAYVQSADIGHARAVASQMRAGNVHLNYPAGDTAAPFGGYKQSGNGRESGKWGLEEFLETKAVIGYQAA